jgi:hypothetical protein
MEINMDELIEVIKEIADPWGWVRSIEKLPKEEEDGNTSN